MNDLCFEFYKTLISLIIITITHNISTRYMLVIPQRMVLHALANMEITTIIGLTSKIVIATEINKSNFGNIMTNKFTDVPRSKNGIHPSLVEQTLSDYH